MVEEIVNPGGPSRVVLCFAMISVGLLCGCDLESTVQPFPDDRIECTKELEGSVYHVVDDGNAYREIEKGKRWAFHAKLYDPEVVKNAYEVTDGTVYRVAPDSEKRFRTVQSIDDGFEDIGDGIAGLQRLVSEERLLWGSFTLQSPRAPTVGEYVTLRNRLLKDGGDFLDASIQSTSEKAFGGKKSLRLNVPAKTGTMITCKASLSSPLVYFRNGDDFWFEAHYWADNILPLTLVDLECEFLEQHGGIRVRIYEDETLGAELKALDKPQFRQPKTNPVRFPKAKWVKVRVHFFLSPTDGKIEIWQDGLQVLDTKGVTLPLKSTIYNSLEVGITAHSDPSGPCTLYLDNLRVSPTPFDQPSSDAE